MGEGVLKKQLEQHPFRAALSVNFLLTSFLCTVGFAFCVGRLCRQLLLPELPLPLSSTEKLETLPQIHFAKDKKVPKSVYSAKHFNTGNKATSSDSFLARRANFGESEVTTDGAVSDNDGEEVHEPAGQHLLIDIKGVDGTFLNSEERLATAMVELINMSGLTVLSYHCHGLEPVGVSCVGVLLESHVSFHTWPISGVITLDLFTCGEGSLLPLVPVIEKLFGVPRRAPIAGGSVEQPHMQWSHKKRGFRSTDGSNPEEVDMSQFLLGWMEFDMKTLVSSVETDFQTVEIYDVINPRFKGLEDYSRSLLSDGSYQSQHPELFRPDRVVYLDGIMQSRLFGEASYHEALVHPAMVSHPNPRRVVIIGGGEGATLREVLKHNTVETVTMVEIDELMVNASREYLPEWSDCSFLVGSADSCFDDPRAETYYTDAVAWFIQRYTDPDVADDLKYDVVIMDALDPSSEVDFSDILYGSRPFVQSLSNAVRDDGVFVGQFGEDLHVGDAPHEYKKRSREYVFMDLLQDYGFESMKTYSEPHGGFLGIWRFLIGFKDSEHKAAFYTNQAQVDLVLRRRAMRTNDGSESPFRYFDGATMMSYQYPSRVVEAVSCRSSNPKLDMCEDGHGINPIVQNIPISSFELRASTIPGANLGLFSTVDIPKGAMIAFDDSVQNMLVMPYTVELLLHMKDKSGSSMFDALNLYMEYYGFTSDFYGYQSYHVDVGLMNFINHGCHGKFNVGHRLSVTEMTADPNQHPPELEEGSFETAFFNPFIDRNHMLHLNGMDTFLEDLPAGTEVKDNYLVYWSEKWKPKIEEMRGLCSQQEA